MDVFKGDDVSAQAMHKSLYGIQRNQMPRILCFEILWLAQYLFALHGYNLPIMPHLLRIAAQSSAVLDDATDGGGGWQTEAVFRAKLREDDIDLVFPYVGMK